MKRIFFLMLAALVLVGCSSRIVPPVNEPASTNRLPGKFVWYDLLSPEVEKSAAFYAELLGWEAAKEPEQAGVRTFFLKGYPIATIFEREGDAQWLCSISVEDVDKAETVAQANGGLVVLNADDMPNRGRMAVIKDPQGAPFAVLASSSGDPMDFAPAEGEWLGGELWTTNVNKAVGFYVTLAGYEVREVDVHAKVKYRTLFKDNELRAGVVSLLYKRVTPQWVPYVAVADVQQTVAKAEQLGGEVLIRPDLSVKEGRVALIKDPAGAVFGVQGLGGE